MSEEHKKIISERQKGNKYNVGRKPDQETKDKLKASHLTPEYRKIWLSARFPERHDD